MQNRELLFSGKFRRKSDFHFPGKLGVGPFLLPLHIIPEKTAVFVFLRCIFREHDLRADDSALLREVVNDTCLLVAELLTGAISCRSDSRPAARSADNADAAVVDGHGDHLPSVARPVWKSQAIQLCTLTHSRIWQHAQTACRPAERSCMQSESRNSVGDAARRGPPRRAAGLHEMVPSAQDRASYVGLRPHISAPLVFLRGSANHMPPGQPSVLRQICNSSQQSLSGPLACSITPLANFPKSPRCPSLHLRAVLLP